MRWDIQNMDFADPNWLWGLLLIPLIAAVKIILRKKQSGDAQLAQNIQMPALRMSNIRPHLFWLGLLALGCWIIAFARPQSSETSTQVMKNEGIDIVLALDVSSSMLALDLKPNRLEALKKVAVDFVEKRPADRIGLVIYSGEALTRIPLTTDHLAVKKSIDGLRNGLIEDGTAIGMGLATAVNRLKESEAKSKVVILITDGENNSGSIEPLTAAGLADEFGVRVYTVGVGTNGSAKMPIGIRNGRYVYGLRQVRIDEDLLTEIADLTGGKYYRATNEGKLAEVYGEIDQLEKSVVEELKFTRREEHFYPWLCAGLILLGSEILLRKTLFRSVN